jgi:phosphate transport system permease protein
VVELSAKGGAPTALAFPVEVSVGIQTEESAERSGHAGVQRRPVEFRTPQRRLLADRAARWAVTGGGLAIIVSILGILVFVLIEVAPLLRGAGVDVGRKSKMNIPAPGVLVSDEYRTHAATLALDGIVRVFRIQDGALVLERDLSDGLADWQTAEGLERPADFSAIAGAPGAPLLAASTTDGRVVAVHAAWEVLFVGQERQVVPGLSDPIVFDLDPDSRPLNVFAVRANEDGTATAVAQLADGRLAISRRTLEENLFTGELTENRQVHISDATPWLSALVLDDAQRTLYGATAAGELIWWRLEGGRARQPQILPTEGVGVTALSLLLGSRALVVGREDGTLEIWFTVRQPDESFALSRIRRFPPLPGPVQLISPSMRNRGFLAQDVSGSLGLYYSTSERVLWNGPSPLPGAGALFYTPKADGALLVSADQLIELRISNPHPEVSLRALFGKVWYEGYSTAEYVWQSTGISDAFESKLSLTPLMFGTLKGTLYSLFLAVPLGVLGAMYTSQFMHSSLSRYVKPTVEIMAALPSVVLGFLAGLWLAPRVERVLPALILMLVLLPLTVIIAGRLWHALPQAFRERFVAGSEALLYALALAVGVWICLHLNGPMEAALFGGNLQDWLFETTGLRYDQRNAIVVGLAMGFAVIPIIFSIAEDAFSNVPRSLVSGSLALGANRWQTVTRVVFPSASPGIFSAIMIGFGRAVGETMIVLMATGNTPVLDWNPFNGFRTLSANIAVEIPEAPQGATLYRTLFLAALILFVFTFLINTVAELVRQRLRKRYSEL